MPPVHQTIIGHRYRIPRTRPRRHQWEQKEEVHDRRRCDTAQHVPAREGRPSVLHLGVTVTGSLSVEMVVEEGRDVVEMTTTLLCFAIFVETSFSVR